MIFIENAKNSDEDTQTNQPDEDEHPRVEDAKLPLQLAIVGRPNVGKSTLLNAILQEDRVLVGPEAGLTRDSIRVQFEYEGRTIYLVSYHYFMLYDALSSNILSVNLFFPAHFHGQIRALLLCCNSC